MSALEAVDTDQTVESHAVSYTPGCPIPEDLFGELDDAFNAFEALYPRQSSLELTRHSWLQNYRDGEVSMVYPHGLLHELEGIRFHQRLKEALPELVPETHRAALTRITHFFYFTEPGAVPFNSEKMPLANIRSFHTDPCEKGTGRLFLTYNQGPHVVAHTETLEGVIRVPSSYRPDVEGEYQWDLGNQIGERALERGEAQLVAIPKGNWGRFVRNTWHRMGEVLSPGIRHCIRASYNLSLVHE